MTTYINLGEADSLRLNQIMYDAYCFDPITQEWIFPFSEGTTSYYNVASKPWVVDDRLVDAPTNPRILPVDQTWIATDVLPTQLDEAQAVAAGWITIPPPPNG